MPLKTQNLIGLQLPVRPPQISTSQGPPHLPRDQKSRCHTHSNDDSHCVGHQREVIEEKQNHERWESDGETSTERCLLAKLDYDHLPEDSPEDGGDQECGYDVGILPVHSYRVLKVEGSVALKELYMYAIQNIFRQKTSLLSGKWI